MGCGKITHTYKMFLFHDGDVFQTDNTLLFPVWGYQRSNFRKSLINIHSSLENFKDYFIDTKASIRLSGRMSFKTLSPRQNGYHFTDDIFEFISISLNEKRCILILISLKFIPNGPINNNPAKATLNIWVNRLPMWGYKELLILAK